jgi:hypothetical protein
MTIRAEDLTEFELAVTAHATHNLKARTRPGSRDGCHWNLTNIRAAAAVPAIACWFAHLTCPIVLHVGVRITRPLRLTLASTL